MHKFEKLDVIKLRKYTFPITIAFIVLVALISLIFGVEVDIEFKGGTLISYSYTGDMDVDSFQAKAEEIIGTGVSLTIGEAISENAANNINLSVNSNAGLTAERQFDLTKKLQESFTSNDITLLSSNDVPPSAGKDITLLSSNDVPPSAGKEFFLKCLVAVAFSAVVLTVYIAFRFKRIGGWSAGVTSVIALLHDAIMVYATFVIFRIPINANFIAAALTILGYSINDTIVTYDRVRENRKIYGKKLNLEELMNVSIRQTLTRSINTSVTTIAAMAVVCIVALIFDVKSILSFAFPLIVGMIAGVYSSVFLAGPLWVLWNDRGKKGTKKKSKSSTVKA